MAARRTRKDDGSNWTVADSRGVYGIRHWGAGYFAINDGGNVECVRRVPTRRPSISTSWSANCARRA